MHCHDAGCFVHTLPPSRSMRCYAYHACLCHSLTFFASLHACLHVYAQVLLASVLSILQHNEAMDIQFKPTFLLSGHHLLFVCLLSHSFVHLACPISCHILCLPCLLCLSTLCLFICSLHPFLPLLVCWFLVFAFACTHMKRGCMEQGHNLPGASKEGVGTSMSI